MTVDPLEIEDTSDWLGCPTELETCRYFLRITENEVQELTLQLRKAREDIFGLVEMHADASRERDQLRAELVKARTDLADSNRRGTDIETKSNWELMANSRHISELTLRIREFTGENPTNGPPDQRDTSRT
jgi:chromosome segregation ATPase